ncbi:MAG: cobalt-precorrin-7 (C(5))-methyltransferase [Candidatus Methanoperedens sp.]|nr:cobalt-precorrin-7 (C(5))-methyltransferase [Candidatus Methanoperedens sp.]
MKIVGVGAGPNLLTTEAASAIKSARIIFGSRRAIELAGDYIKCEVHEIEDYTLNSLPQDAVVLSTGDPMLSGLGKFAKTGDVVIPGISSLQLACSRIRLDVEGVAVITAHSRNVEAVKSRLIKELENGKNVFLLPDASFGVDEIAAMLKQRGISRRIWVFEKLAYPDERISEGTTERPPVAKTGLYCIMIEGEP